METINLKACGSCNAGLLESDRYCRRCGVRQVLDAPAFGESGHGADDKTATEYTTAPLTPPDSSRPVSGPLTQVMAAGVSTDSLPACYGPVLRQIILALISIPIWLLLILLSPLDAYVTARAVAMRE